VDVCFPTQNETKAPKHTTWRRKSQKTFPLLYFPLICLSRQFSIRMTPMEVLVAFSFDDKDKITTPEEV
jgi:hypothetical protein